MYRSSTTQIIGVMAMVALVIGLSKPTLAAPPENNPGQPFAEMTAQHDMIKQDIADAQTAIQTDIAEVKALVEALDGGGTTPCGAGTAGERFVLQGGGTEVCDNTTGYIWEQTPDTGVFTHAQAITHCQSKGGGWDLPEVQQLGSVVGYGNTNPALPTGHPFTIPAPDAIVTTIGYWAATLFAGAPTTTGWAIAFIDGDVDMVGLGRNNIRAWCVR